MTQTNAIAQMPQCTLIGDRSTLNPLQTIFGPELPEGQPYTLDFRSGGSDDVGGIYSIRNTTNNRLYIGGTYRVKGRWYAHRADLKANRHVCLPLQSDYNEHGAESFVFLLEEKTEQYQQREENIIRALALASPGRLYNLILNPLSDERLTIADLARALDPDMDRSVVQRYDRNEELQRLLEKDDKTYPAQTLRYWQAIAAARKQEPPLVRPETAAIFVRALMEREQSGEDIIGHRSSDTHLYKTSDTLAMIEKLPQQGDEAIALLRQLLNHFSQCPPDDRLLTLKDAHSEYGVSLPTLRRLAVMEGRRKKVRRSDILRCIQHLQTT